MPATAIVNLIMSVLVTAAWFVIGHVTGRRVAARDFAEELHSCRRRIAQLQSDRGPCTCPADDPEADEDIDGVERVRRASAALKRHFESVQIVATACDPETGLTAMDTWGDGNLFARVASVREWADQQSFAHVEGSDD